MKQRLMTMLPRPLTDLARTIQGQFFVAAYSQEGEDMIMRRLFEGKKMGFYIDVGAHHPKRFSNTYLFYKMGWSGINIDAMPGSMTPFRRSRPRDINVEAAIGRGAQRLTYFMFNDPALNTFEEGLARSRDGRGSFRLVKQQEIVTVTLAELLDKHLPAGQAIDFLSIDVEGLDLDVLQSSNWQRYRPEYLLVESAGTTVLEAMQDNIGMFLSAQGFNLIAKTVSTAIFQDQRRGGVD